MCARYLLSVCVSFFISLGAYYTICVLFQYSSRLHSANLVSLLGLFADQDPCRAPKDPGNAA
ncbi:MAG: hypothetical protein ACK55Z_24245, partial [bacterium]